MVEQIKHIVVAGNAGRQFIKAIESAHLWHLPSYESDSKNRTRITVVLDSMSDMYDFIFEYQELFDNSYWRVVNLSKTLPAVELHRPQYEGRRKDFVDVEWEFVICSFSNPPLQEKIQRWAHNSKQQLLISLCYEDDAKNKNYAEKLRRRLPASVEIEVFDDNPDAAAVRMAELLEMAKYLHYFYTISYEQKHVPTELPEDEVNRKWNEIVDERLRMSNIYNVMTIPVKMQILGHDRSDWDKLYALTAGELDMLTAVEHNRWCVERLIQGTRPCTDEECREVEEDMRRRLTDREYAEANPISLKKKYKTERNAHYDLRAFSELGVDETGLSVSRYDRDLSAAIPLIVKSYNDSHRNG